MKAEWREPSGVSRELTVTGPLARLRLDWKRRKSSGDSSGMARAQYRLHNDNHRVFKGLREFRQLIMVFLFTFPFRSALP